MAWYLNPALSAFRRAVDARWPGRDRASDGTIGDDAHKKRDSDHNPDPDGSVDAWDMDVDGVDVELCKQVFEAHPAAGYWIHNDQIAFKSEGWRRRSYAYAGPNRNRHTRHVHWNTDPAHENSDAPWVFPDQEEEDMRFLHGQILPRDEVTIVCTPWDASQISFGTDLGYGKVKLRVAEHVVGKGWSVQTVTLSSADDHRVDLPWRDRVDRRSIMRVPVDDNDPLDTPVGYLAWWR